MLMLYSEMLKSIQIPRSKSPQNLINHFLLQTLQKLSNNVDIFQLILQTDRTNQPTNITFTLAAAAAAAAAHQLRKQ